MRYEKISGYMLGLTSTEKGDYDEEALRDALEDVAKEWFSIMAGRKRKKAKRGEGFMEGFALGQQEQKRRPLDVVMLFLHVPGDLRDL